MSTDYSEQIFQAVDTIISQRLNEVSFDKTEICEVISQNKDFPNRYLVSNGALKFEARSDDTSREYSDGSKVYVRITNGDYNLEKVITGAYTADEIPKNLYTNPFDHLIASSEISIPTSELKVAAKKDGTETIKSVTKTGLTFHYSGLGQFNYIGLDFSATTGFGGTIGEFQIIIDLLNSNGASLLTNEQKGLLTFSSRQLYGNPYYLTSALHFQHLFNFPLEYNNVKFSDLTQVKQIKVTLRSLGNFNYPNAVTTTDISINSLKLYFGFDSTEDSMSENTLALVLDNPVNDLEYSTDTDEKKMSIDWRNLTTNAIYNETENKQYPTAGECYVYWLQYSESIGYTKTLETSIDDMSKIDINESGTYWKTVQKKDASEAAAYTYTLSPCADWKKEQIKVIVKHKNGDYIESNGLTFTNTEFRTETGSNKGKADTLRLTLSEGDDGVYNSYGIDNRLLNSYNLTHSLTVDYVDNNKWDWNPSIQKVIWKIPAKATMIKYPGDNWRLENNFYIYDSDPNLKTINFNLSEQFSYNKTNNTIYCEIIRYKYPNSTEIENDEYQGSITLQFGLQGTVGTGWAFNIVQNQRALSTPASDQNKMILTATFEDAKGQPIDKNSWVSKVEWSWYQTQYDSSEATKRYSMSSTSGESITITRNDHIDYYAIIQAKLKDWQDKNGNKVELTAYLPIAAGNPNYYLTGASRVIYNNQGTTPSYDEAPYVLYNSNHTIVNNTDYTYSIISPETNKNKCFSINTNEGNLKPLSLLPTQIPKMALQIYDTKNKWISYIQPILILKNGYQSKLLNEWDGNLKVDPENNKILSALIGAGVKNNDNTFTGVLMGAVGKEMSTAVTGIYGYQSGDLRFKLDEQGNFYVGNGFDNRIDFSGTTDKTLTIEAENFKLKVGSDLYFSNTAEASDKKYWLRFQDKVYFHTNGNVTIGGWSIDKDKIYSDTTRKIDKVDYPFRTFMQNANIGSNAFGIYYTKKVDGEDKHIYPFRITHDGKLYASGAEIDGKFTLSAGSKMNGNDISEYSTFSATKTSIVATVGKTLESYATLKVLEDKISAVVKNENSSFGWDLNATSWALKANGKNLLYADKDGITIYGKLDLKNGASVNGTLATANIPNLNANKITSGTISTSRLESKVITTDNFSAQTINASKITTGTLTVSKISWSGSFGTAQIPTLSANKISGGSISASNFNVNSYVKLLINGHVEFTNNTGFFTMGPKADGTPGYTHPWISGINVAGANGISFRTPTDPNDKKQALSITNHGNGKAHIGVGWDGESYGLTIKNTYGYVQLIAQSNSTTHASYYMWDQIQLNAYKTAKVWAKGNSLASGQVKTTKGDASSKVLKTNFKKFNQDDYDQAYQLLNQLSLYEYDYKYPIYKDRHQYGFIIDEIEQLDYCNKFFRFEEFLAKIGKGIFDPTYTDEPEHIKKQLQTKQNFIKYKEYDSDVLDKYLLTICKALQQQIEGLKQEIKEIKQNEI